MNKNNVRVRKILETDRIANKVLIKYAIAAVMYIILFILHRSYMKPRLVLTTAATMLICGVVCFAMHKKTGWTKSYGHMFICFFVASIFCCLSFITGTLFGIDTLLRLNEIQALRILLNSRTETVIVAVSGVIYLVIMTAYNILKIRRLK